MCWWEGLKELYSTSCQGPFAARVAFTLVRGTKSFSSGDSEGGTANYVLEEL